MTPYSRDFVVTTTGANEIVALDFPGRAHLRRIVIVRPATGAVAVDLYSRAFTSAAVAITSIENNGSTKCRLRMAAPLAVRVGDVITVAGTSVGGYNASHRVTRVQHIGPQADDSGWRLIDTDVAFSAAATGGTATLAIPSAEQPLYHLASQLTGTTTVESALDVPFINTDPVPNVNTGIKRKIYLKFATADTYRVSLSGLSGSQLGNG